MSQENNRTSKDADKRYPASDPQLPENMNAGTPPDSNAPPNNMADALTKGATGDVIEKSEEIVKSDDLPRPEPDNSGEKELGLHRCLGFHDIGQTIAGKSDET